MSEPEQGTTTLSDELVEMAHRLIEMDKELGREARVRPAKRWLMVVGLGIEALADEVRRLEKPITGRSRG